MLALLFFVSSAWAGPCSLQEVVNVLAHHSVEGTYKTKVMASIRYDFGGKVAGILDYSWDTETKKLFVGNLTIDQHFQGRGVSKGLYQRMLAAHPEATAIESVLMEDNLKAATEGKHFTEMSKEECVRAVMKTPSYKARKSLGFGNITRCTFSSVFQAIRLITEK